MTSLKKWMASPGNLRWRRVCDSEGSGDDQTQCVIRTSFRTFDLLSRLGQQLLRYLPSLICGICDLHVKEIWHRGLHTEPQCLDVRSQFWVRSLLQL